MLFEHFDSLYPKGMCGISKRYDIDVLYDNMLTNFFAVTLIIFFYKEFQHMSFASDNCAFCHQTKTPTRILFEHFDSLYPKIGRAHV